MTAEQDQTLEQRVRSLEDHRAISQMVCAYCYAIDGCNTEVVASLYSDDCVFGVGDVGAYNGSAKVAAITTDPRHLALVAAGCTHVATQPYVVIDGDRASATCHTLVIQHGEAGFSISRVSASRLELARTNRGQWVIERRQNYLMDGAASGPALLARLLEGPGVLDDPKFDLPARS